jgi:hypothetical protein
MIGHLLEAEENHEKLFIQPWAAPLSNYVTLFIVI